MKALWVLIFLMSSVVQSAQAASFECEGRSRSKEVAVAQLEISSRKVISGEIYVGGQEEALFEDIRPQGTRTFNGERFTVYELSEDGYGGYTYLYISTKKRRDGSFPIFATIDHYSEAGHTYSNYVRLTCE